MRVHNPEELAQMQADKGLSIVAEIASKTVGVSGLPMAEEFATMAQELFEASQALEIAAVLMTVKACGDLRVVCPDCRAAFNYRDSLHKVKGL